MRAHERAVDLVDGAEEAHDELVGGVLVYLMRLADLLHDAVVEDDDLVGDVHRLFLVVRHDHGRHVHVVVQVSQARA